MKKNSFKRSIIWMIILVSMFSGKNLFAQVKGDNISFNGATANRYVIGLKYHIPVKVKRGIFPFRKTRWQFLAHSVGDANNPDLVTENTKWQMAFCESRKDAKMIIGANSPVLVDIALVDTKHRKKISEDKKSFYVIYNWQPIMMTKEGKIIPVPIGGHMFD